MGLDGPPLSQIRAFLVEAPKATDTLLTLPPQGTSSATARRRGPGPSGAPYRRELGGQVQAEPRCQLPA